MLVPVADINRIAIWKRHQTSRAAAVHSLVPAIEPKESLACLFQPNVYGPKGPLPYPLPRISTIQNIIADELRNPVSWPSR
jgi:hypothetical protein